MSALWWVAIGVAVAVGGIVLIAMSALVAAGRADRLSEQMGEEAPVLPIAEAREKRGRTADTAAPVDTTKRGS